MADVPGEADRLEEAGRRKILRSCLLFGAPLLAILVVAGLQYAGAVHLEEYFWTDPDKVDLPKLWLVLAVMASFQFLIVAIAVFQGWAGLRRAGQLRQLRQQPASGGSEGVSGEAR